jgi:hypothetical protein
MNKRAETTVLEVIIGIVIAGVVFTITTIMLTSLLSAGDSEQNSFNELIQTIKEINDDKNPGAKTIMVFNHKDESFLYPYTKNFKNFKFQDQELGQEVNIILPYTEECKDGVCYCLCQKFEEGKCVSGNLYCESLPKIKLSPGTEKLVLKKWYPGSAQSSRVRIIKCKDGETYCKNSEDGDISVIFDILDQNNLYNDIK